MRKVFLTVFICFLLVLTACDGGMSNPGGTNPPAPETELGLPERIDVITHPDTSDCSIIEDEVLMDLSDSINNIESKRGASFEELYDKNGNLIMTIFSEFKDGYAFRKTYKMGDDLSSYNLKTVKEGSVVVENYILTSESWLPKLMSLTIDGISYEAGSEMYKAWQDELYPLQHNEENKSNRRSRKECIITIDGTQYEVVEDRYQIDDVSEIHIYSMEPDYYGTSSFTYWFGINNALNGMSYLSIDEGPYKGNYREG